MPAPQNVEQGTGDEEQEMKGDNLAGRLLDFADQVLRLCRDLRQDVPGRHVARQLIRAATAGGAIYEEARGAESRADFVHKIGIATKEVRESLYWLKLIQRSELAPGRDLGKLIQEASELVAILTASGRTAKARSGSPQTTDDDVPLAGDGGQS
jgi:four helix bundle protein